MQSWRRYTIIGVLAFIAGAAVWASMAWSDTVNFDVPKGQTAPAPIKFDCGHLFGSGSSGAGSHSVSANGPKLSHKPCSGRTSRRVLAFLDGAVGVAALVLLLTRFPAQRVDVPPAG
ncbi:MAG TPA: hypothetical protein VFA83_16525 [Acidimicrobiales bacterium]|nr:hypothetical protein [Acidimicrobiales bacterium]